MNNFNPSPEFEEKIRTAMAVPDAGPEFVRKLNSELERMPARTQSHFVWRPVWAFAFVLVLLVLVISLPGAAAAIGRLFGYVPNVGLVENTGSLRMLTEPVSLTREGVTLSIKNVLVYEDHIELIYDVSGIAPENDANQAEDASTDPTAFCGGVNVGDLYNKDGDPRLKLPNGNLLERDYTGKYPQNVFAMQPVYEASLPKDATHLTFVLKCIPWARLGAAPENWEVPFDVKPIPAGTLVGGPVIEVEQPTQIPPTREAAVTTATEAAALPRPVVTLSLQKIAPLESTTLFYFSLDMENKDPSLISIMPAAVSVIDSQGQKIQLIGDFPWQPFEHRLGSLFEYRSASKPADGPLTLVVENVALYYAPLHTDPPQAKPEEMSFSFDAGTNPQKGQTWTLNDEIEIAGYTVKIISAKATTFEDIATPDFIYGSQGFDFGYQFAVQADPSVKLNVWMDIITPNSSCWLSNNASLVPTDSSVLFTQLCEGGFPSGVVNVTIDELSVLLENTLQATWTP